MIEFRWLTVHMPFRFLWLKYVTGTNLDQHCAKSLKGEYSERVKPQPGIYRDIVLDEHPAKILYLCGVAKPYNWSKNFHLAMIAKPGESFSVSESNITVEVTGAIPLPILPDAISKIKHPKRELKQFRTCRNWQFANFLELTGLLETGQ